MKGVEDGERGREREGERDRGGRDEGEGEMKMGHSLEIFPVPRPC